MQYSETELALLVQQYVFPFARLAALFMVMPIISTRLVPARIRLVLAVLVTILIVPILPSFNPGPLFSLTTLLALTYEIFLGLVVGFSFQVVFQVFVLGAQFIAMKLGLGFASMNDPTNGVQTTVLSQFFLLLSTLMFVTTNGHIVLIKMLVESFQVFPPMGFSPRAEWAIELVSLGGWMFASALLMALPVLTAIMLVNIAFGVMSRAAPQLNIFAVGFPFTLIAGLALIWLGLSQFGETFEQVINEGFFFVDDMLRL